MKRGASLFEKASGVINGARQDQYGNPEDNFANIAERWTQYLVGRGLLNPAQAEGLGSTDVAFMMMDFKMARQCASPKRDNVVDLVGYAGILDDLENR